MNAFNVMYVKLQKHKRVPFPSSNKKSTFPFYLVHTSPIPNVSMACWFVTFIDDCTHVTWVFLLIHKSEVSNVFQNFISLIKNQFGVSIKKLKSDNGKESFMSLLVSKHHNKMAWQKEKIGTY